MTGISVTQLQSQATTLAPGFAISVIVAMTAQFLSEHYGAPALLMALLLGMAFNFLSKEGTKTSAGIAFTARTVLRIGVALLGARISVELLSTLGWTMIGFVALGVIITILFGLAVSRFTKFDWHFALLTSGSVAICGASAAMAISAILPKRENDDRDLSFTVLGVTVLSTIAMVIYPIITGWLGMDDRQAGIFLGGTIHDVAQVVGAGFSISNDAGEAATVVKLFRVTMLAPVVLVASLMIRRMVAETETGGKRPPLLPGFVIVFLVLATLNSLHLIPEALINISIDVSRWALLTAIAAVGIKTSIAKMLKVGGPAIGLLVAETLVIGIFILAIILTLS
ncbi:MAG: putative sulfate exporter family transporter [Pseudomonadota bacterium]